MPNTKGSKLSPYHRRRIREGMKNSQKFQEAIRLRNKNWIPPMKGHNYDHGKGDVCRKCGEIHKHSQQGKPLTLAQKLKVSQGLKNSKLLRNSINAHYEEKTKRFLRARYHLPGKVEFSPATLYAHKFARNVLINGEARTGFISSGSPMTPPQWMKNNETEFDDLVELLDTIRSEEETPMICNGEGHEWIIARENKQYCSTEIVCERCGLVFIESLLIHNGHNGDSKSEDSARGYRARRWLKGEMAS